MPDPYQVDTMDIRNVAKLAVKTDSSATSTCQSRLEHVPFIANQYLSGVRFRIGISHQRAVRRRCRTLRRHGAGLELFSKTLPFAGAPLSRIRREVRVTYRRSMKQMMNKKVGVLLNPPRLAYVTAQRRLEMHAPRFRHGDNQFRIDLLRPLQSSRRLHPIFCWLCIQYG